MIETIHAALGLSAGSQGRSMFERVLVPLDGTKFAESILPYITALARSLEMEVVLVSVVPPRGRSETFGFSLKRDLKVVEHRLAQQGLQAKSVVEYGFVADQIIRVAERERCNLIAMSTHGRSTLARVLAGSVTDQVIRSSHVPTLTVVPNTPPGQDEEGTAIPRIIVPLDGSTFAERALPYAEELARQLSLELTLVRVIDTGGPYSGLLDDARDVGVLPEIKADATGYISDKAVELRARGLEVRWDILTGIPGDSIAEQAQKTPHDLVVMATHGRWGVNRWVEGSVTERVIRFSGDPVLVIRPRETEDARTAAG